MAKMKYYSSDKCCIITGTSPCALHHVKSRGAGGKDDAFNLMPLSAYHYNEIHVGGTKKFAEKYPEAKKWLRENGWYICELRGEWTRD